MAHAREVIEPSITARWRAHGRENGEPETSRKGIGGTSLLPEVTKGITIEERAP